VDDIFKALSDPTRRSILDALFAEDGQTVSGLEERFEMTRFGVMKHLGILEDAGLIVTVKRGREKLHFLNAVPIQQIHERWTSKYSAHTASSLISLKHDLERNMEKVYEIFIRTTPEKLWAAITDSSIRSKYMFGSTFAGELEPGTRYEARNPSLEGLMGDGETIEVDPPRKLVQTMRVLFDDAAKAEGYSRLTWEIEQIEDSCRLIFTQDQMRENADPHLFGGWTMMLSGLKTWLETGEILTTPESLRVARAGQK
jgi:uncharacterized protein YndB with AHSA1/START domain